MATRHVQAAQVTRGVSRCSQATGKVRQGRITPLHNLLALRAAQREAFHKAEEDMPKHCLSQAERLLRKLACVPRCGLGGRHSNTTPNTSNTPSNAENLLTLCSPCEPRRDAEAWHTVVWHAGAKVRGGSQGPGLLC